MGMSYAVRASWVMESWTEHCLQNSNSQNCYAENGNKYFWEETRKERSDRAVTGTIWKFTDDNRARRSGTFRIESDGSITRAPKFLKNATPTKSALDKRYIETFNRDTPENIVAQNHLSFNAAKMIGVK